MPIKDPKKRKEYFKKYAEKNKDKIKESKKEYYLSNKDKCNSNTKEYRDKKPWVNFFVNAKQRCTNPNHPSYKWYGEKGVQFKLTLPEVEKIWKRDKASEMNRPSLDRKRSDKDYSYSNCRFVELSLNVAKKLSDMES